MIELKGKYTECKINFIGEKHEEVICNFNFVTVRSKRFC